MSRRLLSMQGDRVLTALWDDGRIIECSVDERVPAFLGRIYLAKVDHIVPSLVVHFCLRVIRSFIIH